MEAGKSYSSSHNSAECWHVSLGLKTDQSPLEDVLEQRRREKRSGGVSLHVTEWREGPIVTNDCCNGGWRDVEPGRWLKAEGARRSVLLQQQEPISNERYGPRKIDGNY